MEKWEIIPECPNYSVSNLGQIYNNKLNRYLTPSYTGDGYAKVNLSSDNGSILTRSVAKLVAEAFVDPPEIVNVDPRHKCDQVIMLDGDFTNLFAGNLAWRPRWIAWQYREQLKKLQPIWFHNKSVLNLRTGIVYDSIIEAGMSQGLLFKEIYKSILDGHALFPYWDQFVWKD